MKPLTDRQREVYDFICGFIANYLHPPSAREIAGAFHFASPMGAHGHIRRLEKKGWLKQDEKLSRVETVLFPDNERTEAGDGV